MPEIEARDWSTYDGENLNCDIGHILEVDLHYPKELHLAHSSLPLAPHKMKIKEQILSPYARRLLKNLRGTDKHESTKLVSTFLPREKYIVHSRNIALYIQLGMVVTKIHRVLEFRTSNFLKEYIDFCTRKRKEAISGFRKRTFKNMSNANFGKFIENTRQHMDCKLVNSRKKIMKWVSCPRYITFKKITHSLYAVFLRRRSVQMRQAWGIGFTILDTSKALLYDHYYNKIKPALGGKVTVLSTDTDSLLLAYTGEKTKDEVYDVLSPILDFSNFSKDHPRYDPSRMNELEFWKDEMKGDDIVAFAGAASKSYALRIALPDSVQLKEEAKCKGIARGARKTIPFQVWHDAVLGNVEHRVDQCTIMSKDHNIKTVSTNKLAVSPFDDKR